jgi:hypothetical protein
MNAINSDIQENKNKKLQSTEHMQEENENYCLIILIICINGANDIYIDHMIVKYDKI